MHFLPRAPAQLGTSHHRLGAFRTDSTHSHYFVRFPLTPPLEDDLRYVPTRVPVLGSPQVPPSTPLSG